MTGGLATTSPTLLPLEWCPNCDYALAGLPAEGVCPECGRPYDQEMVVLHGRAGGVHVNLVNSRWRLVVIEIFCFGAFLVSIWFAGSSRRWLILSALAALAYFAAIIARRRTGRRTGLAQVRMNIAGCMQDDSPDDGPNTGPLRMVAETFVAMVPPSFGILSSRFSQLFWAAMVVASIAHQHVLPLRARARWRRIVAELPGGPALMPAWRGWWTPAPVPWSVVNGFTFQPLRKPDSDVTHELVIRATAPWWRSSDRQPVHLLFRCTPEQASELSGRLVAWREFARRGRKLTIKKT